jgi:hypothetical protein
MLAGKKYGIRHNLVCNIGFGDDGGILELLEQQEIF